jgi:5-methylcytosine-specific restriction endonuclease McrA
MVMRVSVLLRTATCEADGCGKKLSEGVEYDHILPLELGGLHVVENLQALCVGCHKKKTAVDVAAIRRAARRQRKLLTGRSKKGSGRKLKSKGFNKTLKRKFSGEILKKDVEN